MKSIMGSIVEIVAEYEEYMESTENMVENGGEYGEHSRVWWRVFEHSPPTPHGGLFSRVQNLGHRRVK